MSFFPAEAYAFSQGDVLVLQLVSQEARKLPSLAPDADGLLTVPVSKIEEVFAVFEKAGVNLRLLG